uniref:Damage-specific DNA-binding protein 2 n=1 Tax=Cacopsylla melanoneura TaxID=428564 RepID=A0A8D8T426_9HEMI
MGPKKRKSTELGDQPPDNSSPRPKRKTRKSQAENQSSNTNPKINSKTTKTSKAMDTQATSKYFRKNESDINTDEPCTSNGTREVVIDKTLNVDKVKKAIRDKEEKMARNTKRIADLEKKTLKKDTQASTTAKNEVPEGSSNPLHVTREVVINKTLDVDAVKKAIRDKEAKMTRNLKKIADLSSMDKDSSKENSKNILNQQTSKKSVSSNLNVTQFVLGRQVNGSGSKSLREIQNWCTSKKFLNFKLLTRNSLVQERITSLVWNKARPQQVAFSDKHGHIVVSDLKQTDNSVKWNISLQKNGVGPGGNILAMKFAKSERPDCYSLWFVGLEGFVVHMDCPHGEENLVIPGDTDGGPVKYSEFIPTNNYNHWYTSMDLTPNETIIGAGCSKGFVQFISPDGTELEKFRAAKKKITHIEFCPKNPIMFVTASLDNMVKIWDRRYLKSPQEDFIHTMSHSKPFNSAYFNERCDMLLVTDQYDNILIYDTTTWSLITTIKHPHRQFQHLTPIKATWHPHADYFVVGRYPMDKADRCLDLYNVNGDRIGTLDSTSEKIQSVASFSPDGNFILSSFGCGIEVWGTKNTI